MSLPVVCPTLILWGKEEDKTDDCKELEQLFLNNRAKVIYTPSTMAPRGAGFVLNLFDAADQPTNPSGCLIIGTTFKWPKMVDKSLPSLLDTPQDFWNTWTKIVIPAYLKEDAYLGRIAMGGRRKWAYRSVNKKCPEISCDKRLGYNGSPKWISPKAMDLIRTDSNLRNAIRKLILYNSGEDIVFGLLFFPFDKPICLISPIKSRLSTSTNSKTPIDKRYISELHIKLGKILDEYYIVVGFKAQVSGYRMLRSRICNGGDR